MTRVKSLSAPVTKPYLFRNQNNVARRRDTLSARALRTGSSVIAVIANYRRRRRVGAGLLGGPRATEDRCPCGRRCAAAVCGRADAGCQACR